MAHSSWTVRVLAVPSAIWVAFSCGVAVHSPNPVMTLLAIGCFPLLPIWVIVWLLASLSGKEKGNSDIQAVKAVKPDQAVAIIPAPPAAEVLASSAPERVVPLPIPGPWRRYIARLLDLLPWAFVVGFAVGLFNTATGLHLMQFPWPYAVVRAVSGLIYLPIVLIIDALVHSACGNGLGKALLGVRVVELDGTRPTFRRYLRRNGSIWARGLAFGLPFAQQLASLVCYLTLKREGQTTWDKTLRFRVVREPCGPVHYLLAVALSILVLGGIAYGMRAHHPGARITHIGAAQSGGAHAVPLSTGDTPSAVNPARLHT
jgi:hypothetical protein